MTAEGLRTATSPWSVSEAIALVVLVEGLQWGYMSLGVHIGCRCATVKGHAGTPTTQQQGTPRRVTKRPAHDVCSKPATAPKYLDITQVRASCRQEREELEAWLLGCQGSRTEENSLTEKGAASPITFEHLLRIITRG